MNSAQGSFWNTSISHSQRLPPPQLLKWIGSKHRFAPEITSFIGDFDRYIEPFVGGGAMLGALAPARGLAGDLIRPLIDIWKAVQQDPEALVASYDERMQKYLVNPKEAYTAIKDAYNTSPNPYDLLFISRSCYGGVVRFTKKGTLSTPLGPHKPIPTETFRRRVLDWQKRIAGTEFVCADFEVTMAQASVGDVVYCDPPYIYAQAILYGAQDFNIVRLWNSIERCKSVGARVLLSIDGHKKSGAQKLHLQIPEGLFEREVAIDVGRSMLRRFQLVGETLENEVVSDRLLLTW